MKNLLLTGLASLTFIYCSGQFNYSEFPIDNVSPTDTSPIESADVDGDGDMDVLIGGNSPILYLNDGYANFIASSNTFVSTYQGSISFGDFDNDNDVDLLLTGQGAHTALYSNDGTGNFTLVSETLFTGITGGEALFFDMDNDLDLDIILSGVDASTNEIAELHKNNGDGTFSLQVSSFVGLDKSSIAIGDLNGDNFMDIVMFGEVNSLLCSTAIYTNNGNGSFTFSSSLFALREGDIQLIDIENDSDLDIILTGITSFTSNIVVSKLYTNNGNATFSELSSPFTSNFLGAIDTADFDNDGDMDVIISGKPNPTQSIGITELYENNGSGTFTLFPGTEFAQVTASSIDIADFNSDGQPDIFLSGINSNSTIKYYSQSLCPPSQSVDIISACQSYTWIDDNEYTQTNNTANIILTNVEGCDSIVTLNLTITNPTTETQIVSSCEPYLWIDGNTYDQNNNSATMLLSNINGCDSTIMLDLTIITIDPAITDNSPVLMANQSAAIYQWVDCDNGNAPISGETKQSFEADINGNYAVIISLNDCEEISSCVEVNNLSLQDSEWTNNYAIYPNPTNNFLTIQSTTGFDFIEIYDCIGKKMMSSKSDSIDLSTLSNGVYTVRIFYQNMSIIKKVVKN